MHPLQTCQSRSDRVAAVRRLAGRCDGRDGVSASSIGARGLTTKRALAAPIVRPPSATTVGDASEHAARPQPREPRCMGIDKAVLSRGHRHTALVAARAPRPVWWPNRRPRRLAAAQRQDPARHCSHRLSAQSPPRPKQVGGHFLPTAWSARPERGNRLQLGLVHAKGHGAPRAHPARHHLATSHRLALPARG